MPESHRIRRAERVQPVIAGVAQTANKDDERIVHPVELLDEVARSALDDAGVKVDSVGAVFATPLSSFGGASTSQMVAERLGISVSIRDDSSYSGAAPQRLLAAACQAVADGTVEAALVVGGIADASVRRARRRGIDPPAPPTAIWSQGSGGIAEGFERMAAAHPEHMAERWARTVAEASAGALMPSAYFALVESLLARDTSPALHRDQLGRMLASFTEAAARRPDVAWFPTVRSAADIATPTDDNRLIAEPYTKLMCSFPTVDLAAAVVVTSDTAASASARVVRPLAIAAGREARPPSGRRHMHRSVALERVVEQALQMASTSADRVELFDLYSCFPAAVQMASNALDLSFEDPRPRTVTGGLPYFGGPGASYSLHGLVCMVEELRARPETLGAVVGLGGMIDDFSCGIYSTAEGRFSTVDIGELDDGPVPVVSHHSGDAVVEAMTVLHDRDEGAVAAPVIARLADGTRVGARAADPDLPTQLSGTSIVGREVQLSTVDDRTVYVLR